MNKANNIDDLISYLKRQSYTKVNVIGSPGSGKTTLVKILSKKLNFKFLNIDELFENNSDTKLILNKLESTLKKEEALILDGTYTSLLSSKRINQTDVFILLNTNTFLCLKRVFNRNLNHQSTYENEKLSFKIIKVILSFRRKYLRIINKKIPIEKIIIFYGQTS